MKVLENKVSIITGAGSGMGKSMALLFGQEGSKVLAVDLREERLQQLEKEIHGSGIQLSTLKVNVANESEIQNMIEEALKRYSGIDILVNNAGILDNFTPAGDLTTEMWKRVMSVNLDAPFFACRAALPFMVKQRSGVIINIASVGGLFGSRAGTAYTASKHALIGLTKNIGFQYAQQGIRCNAIAPGGVETNITENMNPNEFGYGRLALGLQTNPRTGKSSEIATVALFLASKQSSFVNGTVLTADGGWTAY